MNVYSYLTNHANSLGFKYFREVLPLYLADIPHLPRVYSPEKISVRAQQLFDNILPTLEQKSTRQDLLCTITKSSNIHNSINDFKIVSTLHKIYSLYDWHDGNHTAMDYSNRFSRILIKLLTQYCFTYTDDEFKSELSRVKILVTSGFNLLANEMPKYEYVLCGSLASDPYTSSWHPYFSDIDIVPLCVSANVEEIRLLKSAYKKVNVPKWIYFNYGGKKGIGGLLSDPLEFLYTTEGLRNATNNELLYLFELFKSSRTLYSPSIGIYEKYLQVLNARLTLVVEPHARAYIDYYEEKH